MRNAISVAAKFCQGYVTSKHKMRKIAVMLYIGITSIHLCGKKDENMGNRFSIEN